MVRRLLLAAALLAATPAAAATCRARLTPPPPPSSHGSRVLTPQDLIGLRDFGPPYDIPGGDRSFALSSDRRQVALILRRADPASNSYCIGLVIVSAKTGAARIVDTGGEPIFAAYDLHGLADQRTGAIDPPPPAWSPDDRYIAFLRRDHGRTQLWVVDANGKVPARPLTDETSDVRNFAWTPGGDRLVYSVRSRIVAARARIAAEGSSAISTIAGSGQWPQPDPSRRRRFRSITAPSASTARSALRVRRIAPRWHRRRSLAFRTTRRCGQSARTGRSPGSRRVMPGDIPARLPWP